MYVKTVVIISVQNSEIYLPLPAREGQREMAERWVCEDKSHQVSWHLACPPNTHWLWWWFLVFSGFLFLRFVCPALLKPQLFNIVSGKGCLSYILHYLKPTTWASVESFLFCCHVEFIVVCCCCLWRVCCFCLLLEEFVIMLLLSMKSLWPMMRVCYSCLWIVLVVCEELSEEFVVMWRVCCSCLSIVSCCHVKNLFVVVFAQILPVRRQIGHWSWSPRPSRTWPTWWSSRPRRASWSTSMPSSRRTWRSWHALSMTFQWVLLVLVVLVGIWHWFDLIKIDLIWLRLIWLRSGILEGEVDLVPINGNWW